MKVLHISGARSWGGNEQQLLYLVEMLRNYEVEQFLFCYEDYPLYFKIKEYPIHIITIPYAKPHKKPYQNALKKAVDEHQFDLLHLHTSDAVTGYVLTDLFKKLNTKTIFSKKGISRKVSILSKYKYNYKNINKILCVSQVVFDHFKTVLYAKNHSKLCVVYDGVKIEELDTDIDLKKQLNLSDTTKIIGNIANHTAAKDLKTLIEMLRVLVYEKEQKDIHLVQIGEFTKRTQELQQLVKDYNLEEYITFLGFTNEAAKIVPQFLIYVMTSVREGGPTTVLEALSQKVPVVSTTVGIVGEAIKDGHNGFITRIGDYDDLATKVAVLVSDTELRDRFTALSYEKCMQSYTIQTLGEKTFEVYQEVIQS